MWDLEILGEMLWSLENPFFYEGVDFLVWSNEPSSVYLVKLAYKFIHMRASEVDRRPSVVVQLLYRVWGFWSPLKVKVFSWKALKDRIPTCHFSGRNIVDSRGISCVLCSYSVESIGHLFVR